MRFMQCIKALLVGLPIVILSFPVFSQYTLRGKIVDNEDAQPLPFVSIVYNERGQGVTAGLDGNFEIVTNNPITELKLSYLGYSPETVRVAAKHYSKPMLIALNPLAYNLAEVMVRPGINPAHRIIHNVYSNRQKNNPERLAEFRYRSYNKMYFTAQRDSLKRVARDETTDSIEQKVERLLNKQHLFMMESVTERAFMHPNLNHETILASRVSGLNDPFLSFIATQYQSFSFYPEQLYLGGKPYLNPISKGSTSRYLFILEDTLFSPSSDTIFVISFRPLKGRRFPGIKGVMNINSNGYAIQNVIAEPIEPPSPSFNIKIQQRYQLIDSVQWFPVELNTNLYLNKVNAPTRDTSSNGSVAMQVTAIGSTYIKDIELLPGLKRRNFSHVEVSFHPQSASRGDEYWLQYRNDSLTSQELRTYHVMDSLGRVSNMNRLMTFFDAMIAGRLPLGPISIDLNNITNYNRFEGYRLGLSLETNRSLSEWFTLGGNLAYGFKDRVTKYGGFASVTLSQYYQVKFECRYSTDVREPGEVHFERQQGMFNTDLFRYFMLTRMDYVEKYSTTLKLRLLKRLTVGFVGSRNHFDVASGFEFNHPNTQGNSFVTNELGVEVKFAKREAYMERSSGLFPLGFEYPVLWFKHYRGILVNGEGASYSTYDVRFSHSIRHRTLGRTSISICGGLTSGDTPTSLLYFTPGGNDKYPLDATHSFGTMHPYEFVSDRYGYAFLRHHFGSSIFKTKSKLFKPQPEVVTNIAYGTYDSNPLHVFTLGQPKTLNRGFFETGVLIHGILSNPIYSMGVGAYYRWGYYASGSWKENLAVKLTLSMNL